MSHNNQVAALPFNPWYQPVYQPAWGYQPYMPVMPPAFNPAASFYQPMPMAMPTANYHWQPMMTPWGSMAPAMGMWPGMALPAAPPKKVEDVTFLNGQRFMPISPDPIAQVTMSHIDMFGWVGLASRVNDFAHIGLTGATTPHLGVASKNVGVYALSTAAWGMNYFQASKRAEHAKKLGDVQAIDLAKEDMFVSASNATRGLLATALSVCAVAGRWFNLVGNKILQGLSGVTAGLGFIHSGVFLKRQLSAHSKISQFSNDFEKAANKKKFLADLKDSLDTEKMKAPSDKELARYKKIAQEEMNSKLEEFELGELACDAKGNSILFSAQSKHWDQINKSAIALYKEAEKEKRLGDLKKVVGEDIALKIANGDNLKIEDVKAAISSSYRASLVKITLFVAGIVATALEILVLAGAISLGPLALPILGLVISLGWLYFDSKGWMAQLEAGTATREDKKYLGWNMVFSALGLGAGAALALNPAALALTGVMSALWFFMSLYAYTKVDESLHLKGIDEGDKAEKKRTERHHYEELREWLLQAKYLKTPAAQPA
jgi:hypothetical protein